MDLDAALKQFDIAETNLVRLEQTWEEMRALIPGGISFLGGSADARSYASLERSLDELVASLPRIDGHSLSLVVPDPDAIAQGRMDAMDIGEPAAMVAVESELEAPSEAIAEYRFRLDRARRRLVRQRALELLSQVDQLLADLTSRAPRDATSLETDDEWNRLVRAITEAERLVGSSVDRRGRWGELRRHLSFAQGVDLHDIAEHDWPSVRRDLEAGLYDEREPLPLAVDDLGSVADAAPGGAVSSALSWQVLDEESFERLVFALIAATPGYQNPQWLMKTNAPDRSRDVSAERVVDDPLSGTMRHRVIVQCKNWPERSIAVSDVNDAVGAMALWEPPPVDVLVIATAGRFSADAVTWIEQHNHAGKRPRIEPWPESHLEMVLAQRPEIVETFGLRGT